MSKKTITVPRKAIMFRGIHPGIATEGYFASSGWLESDEAFNEVLGRSFGWYDLVDKVSYKDDKDAFRMMTPEEYVEHLPKLKEFDDMMNARKTAKIEHEQAVHETNENLEQ